MKNCLVLGFGRSGTSLMGGILHNSGYFLGADLYPSRDTNPTGFFETLLINEINEDILRTYDYVKLHASNPIPTRQWSPYQPGNGHRWLSFIQPETTISNEDESVSSRIRDAVSCTGFAYKDPRFNYTLGVWSKFLPDDTVFICLFRQPDIVVNSVLKECQSATYLKKFYIDEELTFQLWNNNYQNIMGHYTLRSDRFRFVHYSQLLDGTAIPKLEAFLDVTLDTSLISHQLNRSRPLGRIPRDSQIMYDQLCKLAGV